MKFFFTRIPYLFCKYLHTSRYCIADATATICNTTLLSSKMPSPKYRSVHADDYNDNSLVNNLTSFELEDEYVIIRTDKTPRHKLACTVVCLLVFLVVAGVYSLHRIEDNGKKESQHIFEQEETSFKLFNTSGDRDQVSSVVTDSEHIILHQHENNNNTYKLVYCYGDSLTYGMVPHSREPHPYAPYLERELNKLYNNNNSYNIIVNHFGYPGWTSNDMHNHFNDDLPNLRICTIIKNNPTLSLMIILVGTNDVGKMGISEKRGTLIVESIEDLYKNALSCADEENNSSFRILALGIPGSAWQEKIPVAAEMVAIINKSLRDYASKKIDYVEFPFVYETPNNTNIWGEDGLHLSKNGYEMLGKELAIDVKSILDTMD